MLQAYNESRNFTGDVFNEPNATENTLNEICTTDGSNFLSSAVFHLIVYFMYCSVFVVALIGNGLVCFIVHSSPRMKTVTNYFIMNLAVGDILMTILCIPFSFVSMLVLRYWPFGMVMCKVVNYSQAVSVFVSSYTLLAISIDRYLAVMRPLKPRLGSVAAKFIVSFVWAGACATAAPIFVVSNIKRPTSWHDICEADVCLEQWEYVEQSHQYSCVLMLLQFGLPLTALVLTYTRIAHMVWGGRPPGEAQTVRDLRLQLAKRKMIRMMVTVVVVFTVCWLPLNVFIILWTIHEQDMEWAMWPGMPYVWFAAHWLAMSHCCYNPVIYCYMNSRYRRGFQQAISCLLRSNMDAIADTRPRCSGDGLPMSDLIGANRITRRGTTSTSLRSQRTSGSVQSARRTHPPVRALSVRSSFR
ncbi:RYamide receptor-like [Leptidea sinapis]|uniref:RYamide receptor-like n=1 Tax=Leptidea sinapis TaxID=189913 RepID=UPI0021316789|nr:RYamide receptor-like [Leptidea sinapis]XP_050685440.1 RYamide receptor-like [Leptidea sinapis]XP_050685446.1 RYamide receptor-like [Leptidea sinapis]XP_050685454.1 RYamide receptor-like [Leptidea sinapis]XP_050685463.1 RYamide receptor-like [Leptidea sinapis]